VQLSVTDGENDPVDRLNLADAFVTLFTLLGPQKVLLSVARLARTREAHRVRLVMAYATLAAACVGVTCTLTAPWLASFVRRQPARRGGRTGGVADRRLHVSSLEVLSRLLGILLSAVGVNLFLPGLAALGVDVGSGH
jgi:small neutral amino acid transporter SnatA (MarC family)